MSSSRVLPYLTLPSNRRLTITSPFPNIQLFFSAYCVMSQDYTHACERAELLGLPIPSEEEWTELRNAQENDQENFEDDDDNAAVQNLDRTGESAQRVGSGLEELNSILSATQKKLNRFKTVCGSLSTLLKVKVGSRGGTPDHKPINRDRNGADDDADVDANVETTTDIATSADDDDTTIDASENRENLTTRDNVTENSETVSRRAIMDKTIVSQVNKLDSLLVQAENAQYSMQHQNKLMRKFLK